MLEDIKNYYQVNPNIATSGQPTSEQFQVIKNAGYETVINLALPTSDQALANEAAIVTGLGMPYFNIPVVWEAPKLDDVRWFFSVMEALKERKVWVHCAVNKRVSCFVYLYQKYGLNLSEKDARYPMYNIWQPNEIWQHFIFEVGDFYERQKLAND
ncbi:protein tyrosine phosphatase family protein [Gloeothece verrucosa]|uniref:DSP-PTPase phosphatase fused to NAD+ Kinase domain-containing protein n=1 Tax=Gloeothece verrucosa (strain PCC 7822) TaxID=497965 RepID=E0UG39_GLOV7|nr:protein tyrosine phosphatase family protein [Gloeothece verrucosa]ADN15540.1 protein of unknown function DUF442 [Gloeothece verrucosa PCC 7822]